MGIPLWHESRQVDCPWMSMSFVKKLQYPAQIHETYSCTNVKGRSPKDVTWNAGLRE